MKRTLAIFVAAIGLMIGLSRGVAASGDTPSVAAWRDAPYAASFRAVPGGVPSGTFTRAGQQQACAAAIVAAEARYGLPKGLLRAIADVESGRPVPGGTAIQPWPWTINAQGQGLFFDTMRQAVQWVRQQQALGVGSIDVGCLQINLFHHPTAFRTLDVAFDPAANADFGARFLLSLYRDTGNWATAVGFYHSRTNTLADGYRERVRTVLSDTRRADCQSGATALQLAWQATLAGAGSRPGATTASVGWSSTPLGATRQRPLAGLLSSSVSCK